jgi:hypothetical protein
MPIDIQYPDSNIIVGLVEDGSQKITFIQGGEIDISDNETQQITRIVAGDISMFKADPSNNPTGEYGSALSISCTNSNFDNPSILASYSYESPDVPGEKNDRVTIQNPTAFSYMDISGGLVSNIVSYGKVIYVNNFEPLSGTFLGTVSDASGNVSMEWQELSIPTLQQVVDTSGGDTIVQSSIHIKGPGPLDSTILSPSRILITNDDGSGNSTNVCKLENNELQLTNSINQFSLLTPDELSFVEDPSLVSISLNNTGLKFYEGEPYSATYAPEYVQIQEIVSSNTTTRLFADSTELIFQEFSNDGHIKSEVRYGKVIKIQSSVPEAGYYLGAVEDASGVVTMQWSDPRPTLQQVLDISGGNTVVGTSIHQQNELLPFTATNFSPARIEITNDDGSGNLLEVCDLHNNFLTLSYSPEIFSFLNPSSLSFNTDPSNSTQVSEYGLQFIVDGSYSSIYGKNGLTLREDGNPNNKTNLYATKMEITNVDGSGNSYLVSLFENDSITLRNVDDFTSYSTPTSFQLRKQEGSSITNSSDLSITGLTISEIGTSSSLTDSNLSFFVDESENARIEKNRLTFYQDGSGCAILGKNDLVFNTNGLETSNYGNLSTRLIENLTPTQRTELTLTPNTIKFQDVSANIITNTVSYGKIIKINEAVPQLGSYLTAVDVSGVTTMTWSVSETPTLQQIVDTSGGNTIVETNFFQTGSNPNNKTAFSPTQIQITNDDGSGNSYEVGLFSDNVLTLKNPQGVVSTLNPNELTFNDAGRYARDEMEIYNGAYKLTISPTQLFFNDVSGSPYQVLTVGSNGNMKWDNQTLFQTGDLDYYVSPIGNDTSGDGSFFRPFATLEKAILTRSLDSRNGVLYTIRILTGTYAMTPVVIPQWTTIRGVSSHSVVLKMDGPYLTDKTAFTMGQYTRLEDVTLQMDVSSNKMVVGVLFPEYTPSRAQMIGVEILINANSVSGTHDQNVYGVWADGDVSGNRVASPLYAMKRCNVQVTSNTTGNVRGVLINAEEFQIRDCVLFAYGSVTTGIGVEVATANGYAVLKTSTVYGSFYDIKQPDLATTAPSCIQLNATDLQTAKSLNGFTVNTEPTHIFFGLGSRVQFTGGGSEVSTPTGTYYLHTGSQISNFSTSVIGATFVQPVIIFEGIVYCNQPLGSSTVTINFYKSAIRSTLGTLFATLAISGTAQIAKFQNKVATFYPVTNGNADYLQVECIITGANLVAQNDICVAVGAY